MKDVLINIKTSQRYAVNGESDTIELTTVGKFGKKNNSFYLSYDESEAIGASGVKTILRIENNNLVTLNRSGAIGGRLVVENNKRNICFYDMPEGSLSIGIYGKTVESNMSDNGGRLYMSYTIDAHTNLISENTVEITVKEVKQ